MAELWTPLLGQADTHFNTLKDSLKDMHFNTFRLITCPVLQIISLKILLTGIAFLHAHPIGCILQLCKISSVSIHPLRRSCTYKTWEQTDIWRDGWTAWFVYTSSKLLFVGCILLEMVCIDLFYTISPHLE